MPNPRVGTVTMDVGEAVKAAKGGAVEFRVEKAGIIHGGDRQGELLEGSAGREYPRLRRCRGESASRTGAKGTYVKKVSISSTMGPGIRVDAAPR
jgi:large subunit ribosomal protein L1